MTAADPRHTITHQGPFPEVLAGEKGCNVYVDHEGRCVPYPELDGTGSASVEAWAVACARSRVAAAERRRHMAERRCTCALAVIYGFVIAGLLVLADAGGAPGIF